MSSNPAGLAIDFTKLELAVQLPPEDDFSDSDLDERENEFAFTKGFQEYSFSAADPVPALPPPSIEQDTARDLSDLSLAERVTRQKEEYFRNFRLPPPPLVEIQVRTIERKLIPPDAFHLYMDNICEDFLQFSVAVFTMGGCINESLIQPHSAHRGTGVWGSEINHGKLAYIETIRVNPKYQRQGVGRWAIKSLLKSPTLADCPFIFTWATALAAGSPFGPPDPDFSSKKHGVISFWRALGFRRVGGTWFFGYARDPQHPMRSLPAADDADVTQVSATSSENVIIQYNSRS